MREAIKTISLSTCYIHTPEEESFAPYNFYFICNTTYTNNFKMIPLSINNQTYFFSVNHVTKELNAKLIYGIHLNTSNYFLSKSLGLNDCEQLDNNPLLNVDLLNEICGIISEIENKYKKPSLELLNSEIFRILGRIRNSVLNASLSQTGQTNKSVN